MASGFRNLPTTALALSAKGHRVFPVRDKRPLIEGYFGDDPYTPGELQGMPWAEATHLGWALPTGYVAIDIDVRDGKQGLLHFEELQAALGTLPATRQQETLTGGRHLVFRVSETPAEGFKANFSRPRNGARADIDIITSGYRFLVLYQPEMLDQPVAVLPRRWLEVITQDVGHTGGWGGEQEAASIFPKGPPTVEKALKVLAAASQGRRNNTLNLVVFALAASGQWTRGSEAKVRETAQHIGLTHGETTKTIDSASTAGRRQRRFSQRWLDCVAHHPDFQGGRRTQVRMTAVVLADLGLTYGSVVGLSSRDLGLRLGVRHTTASRSLNKLIKAGLLQRVDWPSPRRALRYQLVVPNGRSCTSHHDYDVDEEEWRLVQQGHFSLAVPLFGHAALTRRKGTRTLPKSTALILTAVFCGVDTVQNLAKSTGLRPKTVRINAHVLQSAGLVHYDPRRTRLVTPAVQDLEAAVGKWAIWAGSQDNHMILSELYRAERRLHLQRLDDEASWSERPPDSSERSLQRTKRPVTGRVETERKRR